MYFTFVTILLTITIVISVISSLSSHWVNHDSHGHAGLWVQCEYNDANNCDCCQDSMNNKSNDIKNNLLVCRVFSILTLVALGIALVCSFSDNLLNCILVLVFTILALIFNIVTMVVFIVKLDNVLLPKTALSWSFFIQIAVISILLLTIVWDGGKVHFLRNQKKVIDDLVIRQDTIQEIDNSILVEAAAKQEVSQQVDADIYVAKLEANALTQQNALAAVQAQANSLSQKLLQTEAQLLSSQSDA